MKKTPLIVNVRSRKSTAEIFFLVFLIIGCLFVSCLFFIHKELKKCRELANPVDGYKISDGEGSPVVGSIVRFACNPGCMLYGSSARLCGKNGRWSGTQPYCKYGNITGGKSK